jgi:hypothetical protein
VDGIGGEGTGEGAVADVMRFLQTSDGCDYNNLSVIAHATTSRSSELRTFNQYQSRVD